MTLAWLLLLVAWPLIEIAVLIKAGGVLGVWLTVAVVIVTGMLGVSVIMRNGLDSTFKVQDAVNRGEAPVAPLMESAVVATAGILLITPGLCADVIGLLLLVPPIRHLAVRGLLRWMLGMSEVDPAQAGERPRGPDGRRPRQPGPVIEGEFERLGERPVDPKQKRGDPH
jgi:UPF0716 protein FxsA